MATLATDLRILEAIYREYGDLFKERSKIDVSDRSKIYVPIDIDKIGEMLHINADELFGRLYYHLDQKFRYDQDNGAKVHLFSIVVGSEKHCINYPYLAGILADYQQQDLRNRWALRLSILSLIIAAAAFVAQVLGEVANAA
jgi:hypothetical protein